MVSALLFDLEMDYEKKYNEALAIAKETYETQPVYRALLEKMFPELRESEDERMMREFNDWLCEEIECRTNDLRDEKDRRTLNMLCYILTKVKERLEKQKEHFRDDTKMVEQKPAQTDDEKEYIRTIKSIISDFIREKKPEDVAYYQQIFDWLDGRHIEQKPYEPKNWPTDKDNLTQEQKPADWSEEDNIIKNVISYLNGEYGFKTHDDDYTYRKGLIRQLKSLRPHHPQLQWKPSEEQMKGLKFFLDFHRSQRNAGTTNWREYDAIESLYEQLKKLI